MITLLIKQIVETQLNTGEKRVLMIVVNNCN